MSKWIPRCASIILMSTLFLLFVFPSKSHGQTDLGSVRCVTKWEAPYKCTDNSCQQSMRIDASGHLYILTDSSDTAQRNYHLWIYASNPEHYTAYDLSPYDNMLFGPRFDFIPFKDFILFFGSDGHLYKYSPVSESFTPLNAQPPAYFWTCHNFDTMGFAPSFGRIGMTSRVVGCASLGEGLRNYVVGVLDLSDNSFKAVRQSYKRSEGGHLEWDRLVVGHDDHLYVIRHEPIALFLSGQVTIEDWGTVDKPNGKILNIDIRNVIRHTV